MGSFFEKQSLSFVQRCGANECLSIGDLTPLTDKPGAR